MFNRHSYQKYESLIQNQLEKEISLKKLMNKRKKSRVEKSQHYKERVKDFLVQMANSPMELGHYQPPISNIVRTIDEQKNLASAQIYINGFKTNIERLKNAVQQQKVLDHTPIPASALSHEFRSRILSKQIQAGMKFQGKDSPKSEKNLSKSVIKLPTINPEFKMHFKAVEQMGNKLKSMQQKQVDRIALMNKLQRVYGGKEVDLQKISLQVLQICKLNKAKTVKTLKTKLKHDDQLD